MFTLQVTGTLQTLIPPFRRHETQNTGLRLSGFQMAFIGFMLCPVRRLIVQHEGKRTKVAVSLQRALAHFPFVFWFSLQRVGEVIKHLSDPARYLARQLFELGAVKRRQALQ